MFSIPEYDLQHPGTKVPMGMWALCAEIILTFSATTFQPLQVV